MQSAKLINTFFSQKYSTFCMVILYFNPCYVHWEEHNTFSHEKHGKYELMKVF